MINVLYVDDESGSVGFQSKIDMLAVYGVNVTCVADVDVVLAKLRETSRTIAVLILDILIPPGDTYDLRDAMDGTNTGILLLRDIRKEFPTLPIVVVSARERSDMTECIERHNVSAYLQKPVSAQELAQAVKTASRTTQRGS